MGVVDLLHDKRFNIFFSFIVGIGLICMIRPMCVGSDCNVNKAPAEKDFDKYVYRMSGGKCYEFKTEIVSCPASGAIEAFRENQNENESPRSKSRSLNYPFGMDEPFRDQFARRITPISTCE